ncbi:MAG: motility protein A [Clostridiales bacterium]|nr:motility protein A [Clostridiales bacterium]
MDLAFIIGFVLLVALLLYGMGFSTLGLFFDPQSIAITLGGVIFATVMSYPLTIWAKFPKYVSHVFKKNPYDPKKFIELIVDYSQEARRKGLLSLEERVMAEEDFFLKKSLMLIVDAIDPAKVREMLETELANLEDRHNQGAMLFEKLAGFGPAYGMIGTLIGLIKMLGNLDLNSADGATNLTKGMATALITTFYGSILANSIFMPIANKLRDNHSKEMLCKELIMEGVIAIQAGDNPKHIEEKLSAYLEEKKRSLEGGEGGGEEGGKKGKKKKGEE